MPSRVDHELAMSTYSMIDAVRLGSGTRHLTQGDAVGLEGGMDTDDLLVRSQTLYPAELRARGFSAVPLMPAFTVAWTNGNYITTNPNS